MIAVDCVCGSCDHCMENEVMSNGSSASNVVAKQTLHHRSGITYVHSWGCGYQELIFASEQLAHRWAVANGVAFTPMGPLRRFMKAH